MKQTSRWPLVLWMLFTQLIGALTLLFWLGAAGMSVMAFDSGVNAQASTFVIAIFAYPLLPIGLGIGAWVAFARKNNKLALILTSLILAPAIFGAIFFTM